MHNPQQKARFLIICFSILSISLLILPAIGPQSTALAQNEPHAISMHAIPGSEGYFKYGEWLLIWVELENSGQEQKGSIEVRVPGSSGTVVYTAPVDLPTNSRKRVPIYVLPNNFTRAVDLELP